MNSFVFSIYCISQENLPNMTFNQVRISDGIDLSVLNTDKFKSGVMTFRVSIPYSAKNVVCALLAVGVLKRGTSSYPTLASLCRRLDELYSSSVDLRSSRLGKNLLLTVTADFIDQKYVPDETDILGGVLEIVNETLSSPNLENGIFPSKMFEQEKRFLADSIDASVNHTRAYAGIRLNELMFASDPEFSSIEQTKEILETIDASSLTEFFNGYIANAPISVLYVGAGDRKLIEKRIFETFSGRQFKKAVPICSPSAEPVCEFRSVVEKMPVSQGKLAMGFKTGVTASKDSDEHYAVILFNEIFGSSPASKLFMNVREKMSLCYYCSSSYNQYFGTLTVSSGIDCSNRNIAEKAILAELENIQKGNISDIELHAAKSSIENSYRQVFDNLYDLQASYGNRILFGFKDSVEVALEKILTVTKEQISSVAENTVLDSVFFIEGTATEGEEECCDD